MNLRFNDNGTPQLKKKKYCTLQYIPSLSPGKWPSQLWRGMTMSQQKIFGGFQSQQQKNNTGTALQQPSHGRERGGGVERGHYCVKCIRRSVESTGRETLCKKKAEEQQ
jgi:hypothetical protein